MTHELAVRIAMAAALGIIAASGNLLGGYFVVRRDWPRRYLQYFVAVGAGYMLAVALLEIIPESVLLASGLGRSRALWAAATLGGATLLGVLLTSVLQGQLKYALPLSGGVTLYVAATDLLPEVNRVPNWRMALLVFVGVGSMLIIKHLFHV